MTDQLDFFDIPAPPASPPSPAPPAAPPDPLLGLAVELADECRCASNVAVIGPGTQIHRAALNCRSCGRHRGWLSKSTGDWIAAVAAKFGAPEIIKIRRGQP